VKQQQSEEIKRRKHRLDERLGRGSRAERGGPMFGGGNESFELSERAVATACGGTGLVHRLVRQVGPAQRTDEAVRVFDGPNPYRVSDHALNLTCNVVCGGRTLDDLELLREDEAYVTVLGAARVPDHTTAGNGARAGRLGGGGRSLRGDLRGRPYWPSSFPSLIPSSHGRGLWTTAARDTPLESGLSFPIGEGQGTRATAAIHGHTALRENPPPSPVGRRVIRSPRTARKASDSESVAGV